MPSLKDVKPLAKLTPPGPTDSGVGLSAAAYEALIKMSDTLFDACAHQCKGDIGMMLTVIDLVRMRLHFDAAAHVPGDEVLRMVRETNKNHLDQLEIGLAVQQKEDASEH